MKLTKLKKIKQYILSLRIPERLKILLRPWPKIRQLVSSWPRLIGLIFVIFIFLYYPLGALVSENIDKRTDYDLAKIDNRSTTVDTISFLIQREVHHKIWTPSLPFVFPAYLLDNMPAFQLGMKSALNTTASALAYQQRNITANDDINPLNSAAELLDYPGNIWMFSPSNKLIPVPSSNSQYRRARKHLQKYNQLLEESKAKFDNSAHTLIPILLNINKDIQKNVGLIENHIKENDSNFYDSKADDIFYFAQGKLYTYFLLIKSLGIDYKNTIVEKEQYQTLTSILKTLEDASNLSPTYVRNGKPDSSFTPNHLYTIAFYAEKTSVNLQKMINGLKKAISME